VNPVAPLEAYHNPSTGYKWHTQYVETEKLGTLPVRVIESPGVYLVGAMQLNPTSINDFLTDHGIKTFSPWGVDRHGAANHINARNDRGTDHELAIELSGRVCYMSYERPRPGGVEAFINNLRAEGHGSVFEHPHYSFIISGVSRNMSLEGNRHRPLSISQLSGRFVNPDEVGFVVNPDLLAPERTDELKGWAKACRGAFDSYREAFDANDTRELRKWAKQWGHEEKSDQEISAIMGPKALRSVTKKARERARDILPGCLETRIMYTCNARAIRFIFEKRCHADAAFEIRRCFNKLFTILKKHDPKIFSDFREEPLPDGTFAVATQYPKI
jgi:thymidylate synthase (FAD)